MAKAAKKTPAKSEPKTAAPAKGAKAAQPTDDSALDALTKGLAALQAKDWAKAVERFEAAVRESDRPEVRDRARQYLAASRQKAGEGEKPAKAPEPDPYLLAVYEKNRGNLKEALEISRKGGRDQKEERFAYLAASVHAIEGRWDEAIQALTKAIELNPKNRVHAFHDPDLAELRKNRDLRPLFGLS
ncbi:MAG: tetratricopeptide repeat protein [Thermoanaerobaculia bacterium]